MGFSWGLTRRERADFPAVSAFSLPRNTHVTRDPAQNYCFTTVRTGGILFHKPLDRIKFNLEATNCLKTRHGIREDYEIFQLRAANNVYGKQKTVLLSPEDACSVRQSNTLSIISVSNCRTYSVTNFRTVSVCAIISY